MINELAGSPTRSENVYFANNEQASIAVFTAVFCFTHAEHHLIKLKLYNNWSAQAVNSVLCEIQRNQSNLLTFNPICRVNQRWKRMWCLVMQFRKMKAHLISSENFSDKTFKHLGQ